MFYRTYRESYDRQGKERKFTWKVAPRLAIQVRSPSTRRESTHANDSELLLVGDQRAAVIREARFGRAGLRPVEGRAPVEEEEGIFLCGWPEEVTGRFGKVVGDSREEDGSTELNGRGAVKVGGSSRVEANSGSRGREMV